MPDNCKHCQKALVKIGDQRKNGKNNLKDWEERKLHKKCWKELIDKFLFEERMKNILR